MTTVQITKCCCW